MNAHEPGIRVVPNVAESPDAALGAAALQSTAPASSSTSSAVRWASITAMFNSDGSAWTDFATDGKFADYFAGNDTLTGDTVHIILPTTANGVPDATTYTGWRSAPDAQVPYYPTVLTPYFHGGVPFDGVCVGWLRGLPDVLMVEGTDTHFTRQQSICVGLRNSTSSGYEDNLEVLWRDVDIDAQGRVSNIRSYYTTMISATANLITGKVTFVTSGPAYP
jgi:hypothetical protein